MATINRRRTQRGSEALEFGMALVPLMAAVALVLDVSWVIFAKGTLQNAVRSGCRMGVTNELPAGETYMLDAIKHRVQYTALGMLGNSDSSPGFELINVEIKAPPDKDCTTDCQLQTLRMGEGRVLNEGDNILIVSVRNYSVSGLLPRFFSGQEKADRSPTNVSAYAMDRMEPISVPPQWGAAPVPGP